MCGDTERRARAITILGEAFRQRMTEITLAAYEMGLSDIAPAAIEDAVRTAIRTCKFMPTAAELRELAGETSGCDRAIKAWGAVEHASNRIGAYRSVDFDDPITNATVRLLGGWPAILERSPQEFDKWVRKDFLTTYASLMRSGVNGEACRPLRGLSEGGGMVNKTDGTAIKYEAPPPVEVQVNLPALPSVTRQRISHKRSSEQVGLELKKP